MNTAETHYSLHFLKHLEISDREQYQPGEYQLMKKKTFTKC